MKKIMIEMKNNNFKFCKERLNFKTMLVAYNETTKYLVLFIITTKYYK